MNSKANIILNIDEAVSRKGNITENIEFLINNYAVNITKTYKGVSKKYKQIYRLKLYSNGFVLNINIEKKITPLTNKISYRLFTIDKDDVSIDDKEGKYEGISISLNDYNNKIIGKNDIYIETISKNDRHNIKSGTQAIKTAIKLCEYLNADNAILYDASSLDCEKLKNKNSYYNKISLKLFKLLTTNTTWYGKYGFELPILDNFKTEYSSIIKRVQNIKMKKILDTLKKMKNSLNNSSKQSLKLWNSFNNNIIIKNDNDKKKKKKKSKKNNNMNSNEFFIRKSALVKEINSIIKKIKDNIKDNDTIKTFSQRIIDEGKCDVYSKIVEKFIFDTNNTLIKNDINVIKLPHQKDIEIMKAISIYNYFSLLYIKKLK